MRLVQTTLEHVRYLLDHLSTLNREEHRLTGLTPEGAMKLAADFLGKGEGRTLIYKDSPAACFGVVLPANCTWFLATEEYWGLGVRGIKIGRATLAEMARKYGPMVTVTASNHPAVDRWFELMGYKKEGEEGQFRWFTYAAPTPTFTVTPSVTVPEVAAPDSIESVV